MSVKLSYRCRARIESVTLVGIVRLIVSSLFLVLPFMVTCIGVSASPDLNPIGLLTEKWKWKTIQSAGGIKVGTPFRDKNRVVFLPVDCDVSGLRKITVEPLGMNSGLVLKKIRVRVIRSEIHLQVITTLAHGSLGSSPKEPVRLGKLARGNYDVLYDSAPEAAVFIDKVTVPE